MLVGAIIGKVDVIYCVSNDMLRHLEQNYPNIKKTKARKVIIRNGIDVDLFDSFVGARGNLRKKFNIDNDVFLIGFLGRFMQEKGFNYLLQAVELLEKWGVDKEYKILSAGSGDYEDWYKKLVKRKKLDHRFLFIPFQRDVLSVYRDIDVLAMPSIWEGCGLLAMEALCTGTPLIVSDCIGLRETVEGTPAIIVESKNPHSLAKAIQMLMNDPQKEKFMEFKPSAVKKYDSKKTAKEVFHLFEDTIKSTSGMSMIISKDQKIQHAQRD